MSILRKGYDFHSGPEIIGFLGKEGKPLKGEVVIPEEDTGIQNYYPGTFTLDTAPETETTIARFEASKPFDKEINVLTFTPETISQDALGYVLSRKSLDT